MNHNCLYTNNRLKQKYIGSVLKNVQYHVYYILTIIRLFVSLPNKYELLSFN